MANISLEIVLRMLFLTLSNANFDFLEQDQEVLQTIRRVELVGKKRVYSCNT